MSAPTNTVKHTPLLPCPFCGSGSVRVDIGLAMFTDGEVTCQECGGNVGNHQTESEAVAAWNRRSPAPQEKGRQDMTPTEKHRETAEALIASRIDSMCMTWDHSFGLMDEQQREGLRRNFRQVAFHDLTPFIAAALTKAEREGMKRAAEIADLHAASPFWGETSGARKIVAAILSEAGEGA